MSSGNLSDINLMFHNTVTKVELLTYMFLCLNIQSTYVDTQNKYVILLNTSGFRRGKVDKFIT